MVAHTLAGLTTRQAILFFAISTAKTVDDHCGLVSRHRWAEVGVSRKEADCGLRGVVQSLPWDPLQIIFSNNADYHDIHRTSFTCACGLYAWSYSTADRSIIVHPQTRLPASRRTSRSLTSSTSSTSTATFPQAYFSGRTLTITPGGLCRSKFLGTRMTRAEFNAKKAARRAKTDFDGKLDPAEADRFKQE